MVTAALLLQVAFVLPVRATTYEVGPGKSYASIGSVPWEGLLAGDTVLIHWRTNSYNEKWVICRQGTNGAPITVRGVPNASGQLPVIDGSGATTRSALNYWNENRGVIKIGGSSRPREVMPTYITIENLEVRSVRPPFTFTGYAGTTQSYLPTAAAIYIEVGENITVRNCILHDNAQGLFVSSSDDAAARDILVETCYFYDNGMENDLYRHSVYTEAAGITFQFNRFGRLRPNCPGNNLKDRSAGLVVRYNWIEGGNRQLDLVDAVDSYRVRGDPRYAQTFVYGNVLIEPADDGNKQLVHYGGDSGQTSLYRKGALYFYNNTVISRRIDGTTLFRFSTGSETGDLRNNIFYAPSSPANTVVLLESSLGVLYLEHNWFTGCASCLLPSNSNFKNDGTSVSGLSPGFVDEANEDFRLTPSSLCINAGTNLAADESLANDLYFQYEKHQGQVSRSVVGAVDIGAFESGFSAIAPAFVIQPQSKVATEGQAVGFTTKTTGTAPFSYQWYRDGVPILEATNTSLQINPASTNDSGSYLVVATNAVGQAISAVANLTVNYDNLAPTIKVLFPVLNGIYTNQMTNSILSARGTAMDGARVEHVRFTLNDTNWQEAVLNTNSTNVSWSVDAFPKPGTNWFSAKAVDFHGRESAVSAIRFLFNVPETFTLHTNGGGAIKATISSLGTPTNGAALLLGRPYSLTATPAPNWVLTNWTDHTGTIIATNAPSISFVMRSNLSISANFIPNPLLRFGGIYNGLFLPEEIATTARTNAGFLNMTVAPTFAYSGKVMIDGDAVSFTGKLRLDGSAAATVLRTRQQKPSLSLSFTLDFAGGSDTLVGSVSESNNWSSPLLANRTVWSTNNFATGLTNYLTMLFPGVTEGSGPSGLGYGAATINTLGSLSFGGTLGDGRPIVQTVPLSKTGQWPFYAAVLPMPKIVTNGFVLVTNAEFQEILLGWVGVAGGQPSGTLTWLRSPVAGDAFPDGFTNQFSLAGSFYRPPRAGVRALAITNALITFSGGNLPQPIAHSLTWTTNNVFLFPPTNSPPKMALTIRNGIFAGTFINPVQTNMTMKVAGAILQNANFGGGVLTGTNFTGRVEITPK